MTHAPQRDVCVHERRVMKTSRLLTTFLAGFLASASQVSAYDLSRYREFQIGMSLAAVAAQAEISSEPRVVQQRPALIQELMWQPPRLLRLAPGGDSVKKVLFSFYNGQLFRMVVTYDRDRTEGLTAADLIDAISVTYGQATLAPQSPAPPLTSTASVPDGTATSPPWPQQSSRSLGYEDTILARWDDAENPTRAGSASSWSRSPSMPLRTSRRLKRLGSTRKKLRSERPNACRNRPKPDASRTRRLGERIRRAFVFDVEIGG
jgi:hypothetical protein